MSPSLSRVEGATLLKIGLWFIEQICQYKGDVCTQCSRLEGINHKDCTTYSQALLWLSSMKQYSDFYMTFHRTLPRERDCEPKYYVICPTWKHRHSDITVLASECLFNVIFPKRLIHQHTNDDKMRFLNLHSDKSWSFQGNTTLQNP